MSWASEEGQHEHRPAQYLASTGQASAASTRSPDPLGKEVCCARNAPAPAELWAPLPKVKGSLRRIKRKGRSSNGAKHNMSSGKNNGCQDSVRITRLGKEQRQGPKKKATPAEKVRSLSMEISSLSQKMKSVPKFSPEWTLSKLEMKLISDELSR